MDWLVQTGLLLTMAALIGLWVSWAAAAHVYNPHRGRGHYGVYDQETALDMEGEDFDEWEAEL